MTEKLPRGATTTVPGYHDLSRKRPSQEKTDERVRKLVFQTGGDLVAIQMIVQGLESHVDFMRRDLATWQVDQDIDQTLATARNRLRDVKLYRGAGAGRWGAAKKKAKPTKKAKRKPTKKASKKNPSRDALRRAMRGT